MIEIIDRENRLVHQEEAYVCALLGSANAKNTDECHVVQVNAYSKKTSQPQNACVYIENQRCI